jgi:hypothetical protein
VAIQLRNSSDIKGININFGNENKTFLVSQYADDTALFLKDQMQIKHAIKIIQHFGNFAGPKLNMEKTEAIQLGEKSEAFIIEDQHIKWPLTPVRFLGIYIGNNEEQCYNENWDQKNEII